MTSTYSRLSVRPILRYINVLILGLHIIFQYTYINVTFIYSIHLEFTIRIYVIMGRAVT